MSRKRYFYLLLFSEEGPTLKLKVRPFFLKIFPVLGLLLLVLSVMGCFLFFQTARLHRQVMVLRGELERARAKNQTLEARILSLEKEKRELLAGAVNELKARSEIIQKLVADFGLEKYLRLKPLATVKAPKSPPEGGVFIPVNPPSEDLALADLPETELASYSKSLLQSVDAYLKVLSGIPLGRPCGGYISSGFGRRRDPFTGKWAFHSGIDIVSYPGTPIKATADGRVIYAGRHAGYGKVVVIRHQYGYSTLYGHLRKIAVRAGQKVKRGQVIGYLGSTGRSTGPHLHYEIRRYGRYLNPYPYWRIKLASQR
ncbi:MAG: hypothetical protein DSZ24_05595 [Thermodesulfatator sp.]|nr:MAG: hypothetical protein DSZ24_05595 [Thermodesulfatator sp.]